MTQEAVQLTETPPLPGLQMAQGINKALETLATDFAGASDPSDKAWPYSTWADTANGVLKRRNAANSAWMIERNLFEDVRLTTSSTDTTPGRALRVGDWGIGGIAPVVPSFDLHSASFGQGSFYVTGAVNGPSAASATAGYVIWQQRSGSLIRVLFMPYNSDEVWSDTYNETSWIGWRRLITDDDVDFTIIYPNGGSASSPANVGINGRIVMSNPFPGFLVRCEAQVYYSSNWGDPGFIGSGSEGFGVRASQLNSSQIIIQTGLNYLIGSAVASGAPFGNSAAIVGPLPCRVLVRKLKGAI